MRGLVFASCGSVMLLAACQETLVFTEQSAFKLGIEVNNDPTTPIQVTAGVKRRVLTVAPPKRPLERSDSGGTRPNGEAVSTVGRFAVDYTEDSPLTGKLTIRTSFASGEAAKELATDPDAVARVVGGPYFEPAPAALKPRQESAARLVRELSSDNADRLAAELGLATGVGAKTRILDAIEAADTPESFERIAAAIQKILNQEV